MVVSNYASSIGQKIGKVFESAIKQYLELRIKERGGTIKSERIVNGNNIEYNVDLVVRNSKNEIVIIIETKFIRYTKHNRDKGSWISSTHQNLRRSNPTITGCFSILGGNWSKPSLDMIQKSGVQIAVVEFDHIANVYEKYGVNIRWREKEDKLKKKAYEDELNLTNADKMKIGKEVIGGIRPILDRIISSV